MPRPSSVLCPSCGSLVGVKDAQCLNCGRRNPGLWGFAHVLRNVGDDMGFAMLVMWTCGALYLASLAADLEGVRTSGLLSIFSPSVPSLFLFGASGAVPVFGYGRWWTVLSAAWLHAGVLHILFNMMWVRDLAPPTARLYGPGRTAIIYIVAGVTGFLASSLAGAVPLLPRFLGGAGFTVGASAPIFGLIGALLHYGRRGGSSYIGQQAKSLAITMLIFGFIVPGIDNWAHLGGLGGGWLAAKVLDPLKPERGDHVLVAIGCLVLSALSIGFSVVEGLKLFRS
ncbi:MAG TPA: rhomboid family intramembrane serine protease [Vicinamibacteria bacterium]|jgi:rhomboid protease GluP|nr:rhomboid family intramembrane serine protease [Vicinamibacteria bacterium]